MKTKLAFDEELFAFVGYTEAEEETSEDATEDSGADTEYLDPTPPTAVRNPENLLKLFKESQAREKAALKQLKAYGGLKPSEIAALQQAKTDSAAKETAAAEERLKTEGQYAQLFEQRLVTEKEKFGKELTQRDKRIQTLEQQLEEKDAELGGVRTKVKTDTLRGKAANAFFANGGKRGDAEVGAEDYFESLWSRYQGRFNLSEDGALEILDDSGKELALDADGKPLSLNGFINQVKTRGSMKGLFDGIAPSGNGTPPSDGKRPRVSSAADQAVRIIHPKDLTSLGAMGISLKDINEGKVIVRPDAVPFKGR